MRSREKRHRDTSEAWDLCPQREDGQGASWRAEALTLAAVMLCQNRLLEGKDQS